MEKRLARHRGTYKPEHLEPYEVSRSQIQSFLNCPACFWMNRVKGIKFPGMPGFLLNTATDTLLKKDFDVYRELQQPHPFMERHGLGHLVPFKHDDFEQWTKSLQLGLRANFEPADFIIGGGLDDVWHNRETDEIHIVDYKSTAQGTRSPDNYIKKAVSLDDPWKISYKRQMDMYVWVMRNKGYDVSDTGYFVYVDAQHKDIMGMLTDSDPAKAWMLFSASIISYKADTTWVEPTLLDIKRFLLEQETCPEHTPIGDNYSGCDVGRYLGAVNVALS